MRPLGPVQRLPNLPAAIKIDDDRRIVLLEHDISGYNIVTDDAERVKVTNTRQDPIQTRFRGIVNR